MFVIWVCTYLILENGYIPHITHAPLSLYPFFSQPAVVIHELGHNFNLAQSGGLNGATYTE